MDATPVQVAVATALARKGEGAFAADRALIASGPAPEGHAFLSPSKHVQWSLCPGSRALEELAGFQDSSSPDAVYGTHAHSLAAAILTNDPNPPAPVDDEMLEGVMVYVEAVRERVAHYERSGAVVSLMVELPLDVSLVTGEAGAQGTADVVIIAQFKEGAVLEVRDLKFGVGEPVDVIGNGQLKIYALAAYFMLSMAYDFTEIHTVIHQPRRITEAQEAPPLTPAQLQEFAVEVMVQAQLALALRGDAAMASQYLNPGAKQCRWCTITATCPAYTKMIESQVLNDFQKVPDPALIAPHEELARRMDQVELVEHWCKAIRKEVYKRLLSGQPVGDYTLYEGKRGNRKFANETLAKQLLTTMYGARVLSDPELMTATQVEKAIGKPDFYALTKSPAPGKPPALLIVQAPGRPVAAKKDLTRVAWTPDNKVSLVLSDFDVVID